MIDPKYLPDPEEGWNQPEVRKPRGTADFINDTWLHRNSPVYVLLPEEYTVLTSKTLKGWLWRLVVRLLRRKSSSVDPLNAMDQEALAAYFDPTAPSESERTMEHYLTIASKWTTPSTPNAAADTTTCGATCDCTEFHSPPKRKPRKHPTKKPAKRSPRSK